MSLEFIKSKTGNIGIDLAKKQQNQLSYFTQSDIQDEINISYIEQWSQRNFIGNDLFLNWVKAIFKTENFLSFFKYFRKPLPSARLINDRIKTSLERVFHAEDSYFKYIIRGVEIDTPEELNFNHFKNKIFNALLFNHNDIIIHDLKDINKPFRDIISINNVVAIESKESVIKRLAYTAKVTVDGESIDGYLYMDDKDYVFYNKSLDKDILNIPHDLGQCPADYIGLEPFKNNDIVRKSIFSYVREELEEYVFLKTLQRMTQPNGVVPIVAQLKSSDDKNKDKKGLPGEPMSSNSISSQQSKEKTGIIGSPTENPFQAGSIVKVKPFKKTDGSLDMDAVKHFLNFFYIPVEASKFLNERINEIEKNIVIDVLGDYSESNEAQKNELQVSKSYQGKQDKLRSLANQMSRVFNRSNYKLLALKYGSDAVEVDCFCGSDFYLETQADLFKLYLNAPNAIIRKNILIRISQNANKFNPNKADREKILYRLMPYSNDKDFDKSSGRGLVDDITFLYQSRFSYWIDSFESIYGDVMFFWEMLGDESESLKILTINNLITNIIKEYYEQAKKSGTLKSVQEQQRQQTQL